jgi:hypothetical protein
LGGLASSYFGRLRADGSLDTSFKANADGSVLTLASLANGKLLVGGNFRNLGKQPRGYVGRINGDGSPDLSFAPDTSGPVYALAMGVHGELLVGGFFGMLAGQARSNLGRLTNNEPATQWLSRDGFNITWLRGGSSPGIWRAVFDLSTNGIDWTSLGDGIPASGGWQLTGITIPAYSAIRARGFVTGGRCNGSSWFVDTTRPGIQAAGFHFGQFVAKTIGSPDQAVVVECSTNLADWILLATNTFGVGPLYFSDSDSTNSPCRFYRLQSP